MNMKAFTSKAKGYAAKAKDEITTAVPIGGSKEVVRDEEYEEKEKRFNHQYGALKKLESQFKEFDKTVKAENAARVAVGRTFSELTEGTRSGTFGEGLEAFNSASSELLQLQEKQSETLHEILDAPLAEYLEQWNSMEKRVKERNKRRDQLGKFQAEQTREETSKKPDQMKIDVAKVRVRHCSHAYEELNQELKKDLDLIDQDLPSFLEPIFATFVDLQNQFAKTTEDGLEKVLPSTKDLDKQRHFHHKHVITPDADSAIHIDPLGTQVK